MSKTMRGLFLMTFASFVAVAVGYVIHITLGRMLGPEGYGLFNSVNSLVTIAAVLTTSGIPIAISKYVSEHRANGDTGRTKGILKKGIIIQAAISLPIFALYLIGANWLAQSMGDPSLAPLIQLGAVMIPLSALFGGFDNFINGMRMFGSQMIDNIVLNIGKLSSIFFVFFGAGVAGAIGGYVLGSALGLISAIILSWLILKKERISEGKASRTRIGYRNLIYFAIPVTAYSVMYSALSNIDILAVKTLLGSNELTGYYSAAAMIAHVPMFLFGGLAVVLLPSLAGSISTGVKETTNKYITSTTRYLLLGLVPMAIIVALTAGDLASLIYTETYRPAGTPLSVLFFGAVLLTFFQVMAVAINAEGRPKIIAAIAGLAILTSLILNWLLNPMIGIIGAAIATATAALVGVILSGIYVNRKHRINIKPSTVSRTVIGILTILVAWFLLSMFFEFKGTLLLIEYAILYGIYWLSLLLMGEITREDREMGLRLFPKPISERIRPFIGR